MKHSVTYLKGKKLSAEKEGDGDDLGDVSEEDEAAEMVIEDDDTTDGLKEMFAKRQEKQKEKERVKHFCYCIYNFVATFSYTHYRFFLPLISRL